MPDAPSALRRFKLSRSLIVFLGLLAIGVFALSLWLERGKTLIAAEEIPAVSYLVENEVRVQAGEAESSQALSSGGEADTVAFSAGLILETAADSELGIYFGEADLIRLSPNTTLEVVSVDDSVHPIDVAVHLKTGELWVSDLQGVIDVTVQTDRVQLSPEFGSVAVTYLDGEVHALAAHHPLVVQFLDETGDALNQYLLTESHEVTIRESKISDVLAQLRYTKLTKEYPFSYLDTDDWEDKWSLALEADEDRLDAVYTNFVSELRRRGESGYAVDSWYGRWVTTYRSIRDVLTWNDSHLAEVQSQESLQLIEQSLYLLLEGNQVGALERLQRFEAEASTLADIDDLKTWVQVFQAVHYGDDFYPVKELLRDIRLENADDSEYLGLALAFQRERLNEVYDLLDVGDLIEAEAGLGVYNSIWEELMASQGSALAGEVLTLTEERQILQNLIYRESTFYDVESFAILSALEERILTLTAEEEDLNEERQAFVQDKLRLLGSLIDLIDADSVGISRGTDVADHLIEEVNMLLSDITVQTAIIAYFETRLSELAVMMKFINSPDYLLLTGDFDTKFDQYLAQQSEIKALSDYIQGLSSSRDEDDANTSVTLDEATTEVKAALAAVGVDVLGVLWLGDTDYRLFSLEGAELDDISFKASYDRETGLIYDLRVEGEAFSSGVKLENLAEALEGALAEVADEEEAVILEDSRAGSLTAVESLAISLAQRSLEEAMDQELEQVVFSIVDLESNLYEVQLPVISGADTIVVTFQYAAAEDVVFDVVGNMDGQLFDVETVELSSFKEDVVTAWQAVAKDE